jgi:hypothetical protein
VVRFEHIVHEVLNGGFYGVADRCRLRFGPNRLSSTCKSTGGDASVSPVCNDCRCSILTYYLFAGRAIDQTSKFAFVALQFGQARGRSSSWVAIIFAAARS